MPSMVNVAGSVDVAGADDVGLGETERVVEMQLAVRGDERAGGTGHDQSVRDPRFVQAFGDTRDEVDALGGGDRLQSGDELAVEWFGGLDQAFVQFRRGEHRVLGRHDHARAGSGRVGSQAPDRGEVVVLVGARTELRDRDLQRNVHTTSLCHRASRSDVAAAVGAGTKLLLTVTSAEDSDETGVANGEARDSDNTVISSNTVISDNTVISSEVTPSSGDLRRPRHR